MFNFKSQFAANVESDCKKTINDKSRVEQKLELLVAGVIGWTFQLVLDFIDYLILTLLQS